MWRLEVERLNWNDGQNNRTRQFIVATVAAVFIVVAVILSGLVTGSIDTLTESADRIDDERSRQTTAGALRALRQQLGATVRDNAFWDDAFDKVNSGERVEWTTENWGTVSGEYPLYDTAIVVDDRNQPVIAYHEGEPMPAAPSSFFRNFDGLLKAARKHRSQDPVPVHFARSIKGTALIGAAAIQPSVLNETHDPKSFKILVFAKHITPEVVDEVSRNFNISGLRLDPLPVRERLDAPLKDVDGQRVASFTWPPQKPGTKSYQLIDSRLQAAAAILVVFLFAIGLAGTMTIRNLRRSEQKSRYKASHDRLTDLLNRAGFLDGLAAANRTPAANGAFVSLHLIDLDGFKAVNDCWGHLVGDELIVAVGRRLKVILPEDSLLARFGGDEFAIVTQTNEGPASVDLGIHRALSGTFDIEGRTIEIGASVGVVSCAAGSFSTTELMRRADAALYRAKDAGRGVTVTFDLSFDEEAQERSRLEHQLRQTLSKGGIDVNFQPLFDANTGKICAVEALARWKTDTGERVAPDVFIPLAERAGLIEILGLQVLVKALDAAAAWPEIGISVNASPLQLQNPRFARQVIEALEEACFEPRRLSIEVTEGVLISNPDQARRAIAELKSAGVKIALDDFGTGYASIGTLRQFGFDGMKIDRSLVAAIEHDHEAGAVLQATIALAVALNIPVTAEGVETEAQAITARLSGCDALQGYLFSKPLSQSELNKHYFADTREAAQAV